MNFDKESKSGIIFFFLGGGGGGQGGWSVVEKGASSSIGKKQVFPMYEYIITYKISSS